MLQVQTKISCCCFDVIYCHAFKL